MVWTSTSTSLLVLLMEVMVSLLRVGTLGVPA